MSSEPNYKHVKLNGCYSSPKLHWKYSEIPTYFDIDINFKLKFDAIKILKDYNCYNEYYWENARKLLSEYSIYLKLINFSDKLFQSFNIIGVFSTTETSIKSISKSLNRNNYNKKYCLGYGLTFKSKTNLMYKKNEIVNISNSFVNYFESNFLLNSDYYTIYK